MSDVVLQCINRIIRCANRSDVEILTDTMNIEAIRCNFGVSRFPNRIGRIRVKHQVAIKVAIQFEVRPMV